TTIHGDARRRNGRNKTQETSMKRLQARQPGAFQDLPAEVQELLAKMREHFPKADLDVLGEAYQFAAQAHHAQTRASGEPYINHSVTVAATLVDLRLDPVTIAAALLHDVAEDTGVTLNEVQAGFGTEIASLVQAEATRSQFLEQVADTLCRELNRAGLRVAREQLTARPKHVYSIWRKMQRPKYAGQPVARIYDRLGVRVIVDDVKDCYAALGVVHSLWKPIPGEFDDYIANPKTSGYQSLHTTVIYEGEPLEIQIRTMQMHREAEHGIAAHWRYKEGKP